MPYGRDRETRATAATDPFLSPCLGALRKAGLRGPGGTPLGTFRWDRNGRTYTAGDLVLAYPCLMAASANLRLQQRDLVSDELVGLAADPLSGIEHERARMIRDLTGEILAGTYHPPGPHTVVIPKLRFGHGIEEKVLRAKWGFESGADQAGERPLVIDSIQQRTLSAALALVLGNYMSRRWDNCVVGCRAGIGTTDVLGMLAHAVQQTGRHHVLAADIEGFFENVDVGRCLDLLDQETGYRQDPMLTRLIELALWNRPPHGLPQGNPLSPVLANLYASHALDPVGLQTGPYLRYVDDLVVLGRSDDELRRTADRLAARGERFGLSLHVEKSRCFDLASRWGYALDQGPAHRTQEPFVYLGVEVRFDRPDGVSFHLTNRAIRRLHEGLREIWHSRLRTGEDPRQRLVECLQRARMRMSGWVEAFGSCEWSVEQEHAVQVIQSLAHLSDAGLQQHARAVLETLEADPPDRQVVVADLAGSCRMRPRDQPYGIGDLRVWPKGGLPRLRERARARFQAVLKRPGDLSWWANGHRHHTATRPYLQESGTLVSEPFALIPMPTGNLVVRQGAAQHGLEDARPNCNDAGEYDCDDLF
jgi:hypothetical protein